MQRGLIKAIGDIPLSLIQQLELKNMNLEVVNAHGAWVTPGIVDLHSHIGIGSAPELDGASNTNSFKAPILPWLCSIDGLNTHDASYELAMAGGVTTAQILPGSTNNIGIHNEIRPTAECSPSLMLLEPPYTFNGSHFVHSLTPHWHACGENPSSVYGITHLDSRWNFCAAYNSAQKIRDAQDSFCAKAESNHWDDLAGKTFPEDLQWESLVNVLCGCVKLAVHCYKAVDLNGIVRLTNEFEFPVASFHHAGETYLVPELLKKTWGGTPAIALFASNFRKKRESDHPVVNSRYLLHEAAQAHYYGLDPALALLSVTYTPATAMGMGHGMLKQVCIGQCSDFANGDVDIVDLEGSTITPGLTSFGAPLGLVEIRLEPSTNNGAVHNPLDGDLPAILGGKAVRAQDRLMFGGQNLLLAYHGGITTAITAPSGTFLQGISTAFLPGAAHARVENASVVDEVTLHVAVSMYSRVGVSMQVGALRNMLFGEGGDHVLRSVRKGKSTLVVNIENADIMVTLLRLKDEYEGHSGRVLCLTFARATEAHILAHEIVKAGVSVIVTQTMLALKAGVNVAIGVVDEYNVCNTRFKVGWFLLTSNGVINRTMALALATTNLATMGAMGGRGGGQRRASGLDFKFHLQ
ncbi:uncharacterized protein EDB91DRAFT_1315483 [Suillus paluster]|uniref:uncharacterized protein n=1 Tax=Suillus paluster TaxID=48578 RepID=UPI001B86099E|nr:uncharacterized protein EDB91DRAFT_1315483 [Suillus paluster]KAG1727960.1 hypothetical protein EDB91DRAFT_1315483 [Suillus paluster]